MPLLFPERLTDAGPRQLLSMPQSGFQRTADPLNSTSLKWCQDGELSKLDLARIVELLSQVDPVAEALMGDRSELRG
jgi:hypothetical protein